MPTKPIKRFAFAELAIVSLPIYIAFCDSKSIGAFSRHMLLHIGLMMLAAPALACMLRGHFPASTPASGTKALLAATLLQSLLFLAWHSPAGLAAAGQYAGVMHISLMFSAIWFWLSVFDQARSHVWRTAFALLLTGKLFCLLAVLLAFAPRLLYGAAGFNQAMPVDLADQQLAGLLMLTICPLTYLLAAIVMVYRWFKNLDDGPATKARSGLASENAA